MARTRNDILNEVDAETKIRLIFKTWKYCCRQDLAKTREEKEKIWRELCRVKYRDEDGCKRCKVDFLNEDVENENKTYGEKLADEICKMCF